jgi:hypothetical protein
VLGRGESRVGDEQLSLEDPHANILAA